MSRTVQYMTEPEFVYNFLEVDQAIYSKVLQILIIFKQEGHGQYEMLIVF